MLPITQEDLKRSGVTNVPDALRMVPGVSVARIDVNAVMDRVNEAKGPVS